MRIILIVADHCRGAFLASHGLVGCVFQVYDLFGRPSVLTAMLAASAPTRHARASRGARSTTAIFLFVSTTRLRRGSAKGNASQEAITGHDGRATIEPMEVNRGDPADFRSPAEHGLRHKAGAALGRFGGGALPARSALRKRRKLFLI